ncbi:MAG: O-antigen ligase family protein [Kiritimatiellae bacterium]|nr:O-antigen ligase family protein [Kiritimatiellia bacterium]
MPADWIRRRPAAAATYELIALTLAVLPALLGPVLFGAVRLWSILPLSISAWLAFLLLALRPLVFRAMVPWSEPPATLTGLLFLAYAVARIPNAVAPYEAMLRVVMIGAGWAAYVVVANLAGRSGRWKWVLGALLTFAALNAVYAWAQHAQGSRAVLWIERDSSYGMRMGGTYVCPNHFANLLAMTAALATGVLTAPEVGWTLKVIAAYAAVLVPWPLILSQSRSGVACAIGAPLLTGMLVSTRRGVKAALAALLALPVLAVVVGVVVWTRADDLRGRLERSPEDLQLRVEMWRGTLRMIRDAPALGHGGGSFHLVDSLYVNLHPGRAAVHAHNDYLHVAAEYGVVGLGLAVMAGVAMVVGLLRLVLRSRHERSARLAAGALGMLAAALAQSLVDFNLHIFGNSLTLLVAIGAVASVAHASGELRNRLPPPWIARAVSLVGGAVAVLALVVAVRALGAHFWVAVAAERALARGDLVAAGRAAERAEAWDPRAIAPLLTRAEVAIQMARTEPDAARRAKLLEQAATLCEEGLRRNPREPGFAHLQAQVLSLRGDDAAALKAFQRLVADYPNRPYFRVRLAAQLERMGRLQEAAEALREALRWMPEDEHARRYLRVLELRIAASAARP